MIVAIRKLEMATYLLEIVMLEETQVIASSLETIDTREAAAITTIIGKAIEGATIATIIGKAIKRIINF